MRTPSILAALVAVIVAHPTISLACGGCFSPPPPDTRPESVQVVTDHRMVFSLSQRQTTLWDQIRYAGNPEDFVWVLPVANAATLRFGLGDDNFVEALDAFSAPTVDGQLPACFRSGPTPRRDAGGFMLGCAQSGAPNNMIPGAGSEGTRISREGESVVGPYAVSVIGAKAGGGQLDEWLTEHGFIIPAGTRAAIDYYIELQFDFIILRLAPGAGVHQMQPVRITTRGYSPVLPLRMIAAGIGDKVGLTLMVIAPSRVEAQGFFNEVIPEEELTFTVATNHSNWREIFTRHARKNDGLSWVIESVQNLFEQSLVYRIGNPSRAPRIDGDAMVPGADGWSDLDGSQSQHDGGLLAMDGFASDDVPWMPGVDASMGSSDGGSAMEMGDGGMVPATDPMVDRRTAFTGLDGHAVITRMRAELSPANLDRDLVLDASDGPMIPTQYFAGTLIGGPACPPGPENYACAVLGGASSTAAEGLVVIVAVLHIRRRRRAARSKAVS